MRRAAVVILCAAVVAGLIRCNSAWTPFARTNGGTQTPVQGKAADNPMSKQSMPPLTAEEKHVILEKGTEQPFTGKYWDRLDNGVYVCRQCGTPLYTSASKLRSECGWPSFDQEIAGAVKRQPDADSRRTEILCAHCGAHLGHVFTGEGYT